MNRKQFLILVVGLIALAGIALMRSQDSSAPSTQRRAGQHLLKDFPVNDVAQVRIKNAKGELHLVHENELWRVRERGGYPADFARLSENLLRVTELKIVQSEAVTAEERARLELIEPGKGEHAGTQVEFKAKDGKVLAALLLGKDYIKKMPGSDTGYPAGRFVSVVGDEGNVAVIAETLSGLEPKAEDWLSKRFVKVEKIASITVSAPDGAVKWKIARAKPDGDFQLEGAKSNEEFDKNNGISAANAISSLIFSDVAVGTNSADTGLDQPTVVKVDTFDAISYTLKIGKPAKDESQYVNVAVSGAPAAARTPAPDEKPADKEKLDKEFKQQRENLEKQIKFEKTLEAWTFFVPRWKLETVLKERGQLKVEKNQMPPMPNPPSS